MKKRLRTFRTEQELVDRLVDWLKAASDGRGHVAREVRSHGSCTADVTVVFDGQLIVIEAKIDKWRDAIGQATLNRVCSDRSYVALPPESISEAVMSVAREWSLGVLEVLPSSIRVREQAPSVIPSTVVREKMLARVNCACAIS